MHVQLIPRLKQVLIRSISTNTFLKENIFPCFFFPLEKPRSNDIAVAINADITEASEVHLPLQRTSTPLEKFLILALGEDIYKISLKYLNRPESKETIKD